MCVFTLLTTSVVPLVATIFFVILYFVANLASPIIFATTTFTPIAVAFVNYNHFAHHTSLAHFNLFHHIFPPYLVFFAPFNILTKSQTCLLVYYYSASIFIEFFCDEKGFVSFLLFIQRTLASHTHYILILPETTEWGYRFKVFNLLFFGSKMGEVEQRWRGGAWWSILRYFSYVPNRQYRL